MLRFAVLSSQWAAEGEVFGGGVHEIARPSGKLLRALAGAEAAGSVEILKASREHRAVLGKHVESQAAGEKAYAKAVADGRWHRGHYEQVIAESNAAAKFAQFERRDADVARHEAVAEGARERLKELG